VATAKWVGLPVAGSTTVDRIMFSVGGSPSASCSSSRDPHLSFICAVRQEPTIHIRVGRPRSVDLSMEIN